MNADFNEQNLPCGDKLIWSNFFSQFQMPIISVCCELDIFEELEKKAMNLGSLSEKLQLETKAIEALIYALCALDLCYIENAIIHLTEQASTYFSSASPCYWGNVLTSLRDNELHKRILKGIKQGAFLNYNNENFTSMWETGDISFEAAGFFTERMQCMSLSTAKHAMALPKFSKINKLLDIGGGSGCFSIEFVRNHPNKKAIIFDLPPVVCHAENYVKESKQHSAIELKAGNFFKDAWPEEIDGILLANILHDWPYETGEFLIENAFRNLKPGGSIFIHEMLLNNDKQGPLEAAIFNMLMYINHKSQQYTFKELTENLMNAGFIEIERHTSSDCYTIISAQKPI